MPDSDKLPFGFSMNMNTRDEATGEELREQQEKPFNIAILANFSGRQQSSSDIPIEDRPFIEIDRYNYDEVLAAMQLRPCLSLDEHSDCIEVALSSIKDFHPDRLYQNVTLFNDLRGMRERLNNPQTFQQALRDYGLQDDQQDSAAGQEAPSQPQPETTPSADSPTDTSQAGLLDSILQETESRTASTTDSTQNSLVDAFIKQLAGKSRTVSRDARQDEVVASIDAEIAQQMRNLLHHPQFQALESTWRALQFLVKRIRSGKNVKLYLLDISQAEVADDLNVDDASQSRLYRRLCDRSQGDISWNLLVTDYRFGADIDDMLTLSQLGVIARQAQALLLAAADESLVGCESFAQNPRVNDWHTDLGDELQQAWTLLRQSPVAQNISLALPRFLLRTPYESKTSSVKAFAFAEMDAEPRHEHHLWGNPGYLKAEQIARAFMQSGWDLKYDKVAYTEDLPLHHYQQGGRTLVKPCAEIALTDAGAARMLAQGLIPLWSVKNSDRIFSGDFHPIAV